MKWSIFKLLLAGGMTGMTLLPLCAQNDSIAPAVKEHRWDKRKHLRYDERWERLKPTHLKWQYAGGMGLNSVGVGWDYGRRCQWETDFQVGFLPAKYAEKFRLTFTVKQNYIPWSICFKEALDGRTLLLRSVHHHHCGRRVLEKGTGTLSRTNTITSVPRCAPISSWDSGSGSVPATTWCATSPCSMS